MKEERKYEGTILQKILTINATIVIAALFIWVLVVAGLLYVLYII